MSLKKIASGLKGLFDVGTKIISNPGKALESLMPFSKGNTKGFFPTLAKGGFNFVKKQAGKWWSTLWDMVSLSGDGSGSYGGGWQSPGSGWSHTDGFGSPRGGGAHDGNDFSASVGTAFHAMHGGTVIRVGGAPAGWSLLVITSLLVTQPVKKLFTKNLVTQKTLRFTKDSTLRLAIHWVF